METFGLKMRSSENLHASFKGGAGMGYSSTTSGATTEYDGREELDGEPGQEKTDHPGKEPDEETDGHHHYYGG